MDAVVVGSDSEVNFQAVALVFGVIFVGVLLTCAAVAQCIKGETWGATGKGRVFKNTEPIYFWYLFGVRLLLGPVLIFAGWYIFNTRL